MEETNYYISIPTQGNNSLEIELQKGKALFILGANGVGKSSLMHNIYSKNQYWNIKRILAHRQTWFTENSVNITSKDKKEREIDIKSRDRQINSRWKDDYASLRPYNSIYDLVNSENIRARNITSAVDEKNIPLAKKLSELQSPLQSINEILKISNIPIEVNIAINEEINATKSAGFTYSAAELSDGEKNALLIATDVLTAEFNTVIMIDEPERHLHRSIISPLLNTLIQKRPDCIFIISTHDVHLPVEHSEANILLVRGCLWEGKICMSWDVDLISREDEIPENIKKEILGAKRELLFVEGEETSLDMQIYQLIYPNVSVLPQGSCSQVEKAVEGIKRTSSVHWVNAYGLIDADDRTPDQIQKVLEKGIAALPVYSVEALYYHCYIIEKIAGKLSGITGEDPVLIYENAISKIITDMVQHKERLCARLSEKKVRNEILSSLPKHSDILQGNTYSKSIDLNTTLQNEIIHFDQLITTNNIDGLLERYPIRETPVITNIVSNLGITKSRYESMVRKLILEVPEIRVFYQSLLQPLTNLINS